MKKFTLLMVALLLGITGVNATTSTIETLWTGTQNTGNWGNDNVDLSYDNKGKLSEIFMKDKIRITYKDAGEDAKVRVANPNGWDKYDDASEADATSGDNQTFEYTITSAVILEKIQQNGILGRGKNITITKIELLKEDGRYDAVPLTIGDDGICTYGSSKHLDFSGISEVTPYYVSEVKTGSVTLTSVETTRAWVGYIVKGTAGTYNIPVTSTEPGWIDAFNYLRYSGDYDGNKVYRSAYSDYSEGGDNATKIKTYYRYIFAKKGSGTPAFYKLAENYSRQKDNTTVYYHELAAHKAYLETTEDITPPSGNAPSIMLDFGNGTTAIMDVFQDEMKQQPVQEDGVYYTLQGTRVQNPTKGLYILNGKKIIVK